MLESLKLAVNRLTRTKRTCPVCKNAHSTEFVSEMVLPPPKEADAITDLKNKKWRYYSDGETEFQLFEEMWRCPDHGNFKHKDVRGCY